ncbi:MAG: hypothetical protein B0D92_04790 [Spirochaeta sp. LUC14_002_19_P3]|nr:MAG: hypothetical protein B0D92_04790 [Spirochaeta sp. LUC14_002_19_P3]
MVNGKESAELPALILKLKARDFIDDSSRFNMLANYVGEYSKSLFEKQDRAENLVSTVLYELISYAVGIAEEQSVVNISFGRNEDDMSFVIASEVKKSSVPKLQELKRSLQNNKAESLYIKLLQSKEYGFSLEGDFGLYMVVNDYNANIDLNYDSAANKFEIRVSVSIKEI